jgi:hypothetical protein
MPSIRTPCEASDISLYLVASKCVVSSYREREECAARSRTGAAVDQVRIPDGGGQFDVFERCSVTYMSSQRSERYASAVGDTDMIRECRRCLRASGRSQARRCIVILFHLTGGCRRGRVLSATVIEQSPTEAPQLLGKSYIKCN